MAYEIVFDRRPAGNGTTRLPWSQTGAVPRSLVDAPMLLWSVTSLTCPGGTGLPSDATNDGCTRYHMPSVRLPWYQRRKRACTPGSTRVSRTRRPSGLRASARGSAIRPRESETHELPPCETVTPATGGSVWMIPVAAWAGAETQAAAQPAAASTPSRALTMPLRL